MAHLRYDTFAALVDTSPCWAGCMPQAPPGAVPGFRQTEPTSPPCGMVTGEAESVGPSAYSPSIPRFPEWTWSCRGHPSCA